MNNNYTNFFELNGKIITEIKVDDPNCITFVTADGYVFSLHHNQDCCEWVRCVHIEGDTKSLIGNTVKMAQDDTCEDPEWYKHGYNDCHTWTVFTLIDDKNNRVDFYWLGESNGYYSETVSVFKTKV